MVRFGTAGLVLAMSVSFSSMGTVEASASQVCRNLEAQIASASRGSTGNTRKYARAAVKQRKALSQTVNMARRNGCVGIFQSRNNRGQCDALEATINKMRANLRQLEARAEGRGGNRSLVAKLRRDYARYQCNTNNRVREVRKRNKTDEKRTARLTAKEANRSAKKKAAKAARVIPVEPGYRTVCVRKCDGYFFPVSFSTKKSRFKADAKACQKLAGAAETDLFYFKLPGETLENGRSLNGKRYTQLDNAFRYQREFVEGCSFTPTDANLIRDMREREAKRKEHPERLPSIRLASLDSDAAIARGLAASPNDRILPGSEADREQMTDEKLAALPEATLGFRDVFQTPQVTEIALASTYFLRHDVFPPTPFARPDPDETIEEKRERIAEMDRLAAEEAALIGKGKFVVSHTDFPPIPFARPGAESIATAAADQNLVEAKVETELAENADPMITNSIGQASPFTIPHDMFPPVPISRPDPEAFVQLSSVQSVEEEDRSQVRGPSL